MLKQGGGRIVSMSSLNALSGGVTAAVSRFAYAAAKAGILGMTRALAKELGPVIAINAICPGVIRTEIDTNVTDRAEEVIKGIALGRPWLCRRRCTAGDVPRHLGAVLHDRPDSDGRRLPVQRLSRLRSGFRRAGQR